MTPVSTTSVTTTAAAEFLLRGRVQGLGVRPAIARLASGLELCGTVGNRGDGVTLFVEGDADAVVAFADRLPSSLPDGAQLEELIRSPASRRGLPSFTIDAGVSSGPVQTDAPLDRAVCEACLDEVHDPLDRRTDYAFTSCTDCGPRYSIICEMPYERRQTAMHEFKLCPDCRAEYADPADRRFHAQTNACPDCGPRLWSTTPDQSARNTGADAVEAAVAVLRSGGIVAIRGLGGYQLLCDVTENSAVERLRERKRRRGKPLAVMVDGSSVRDLPREELAVLRAPANPIVLVPRSCLPALAESVAPGLDTVGVMHPTTPLHDQLLRGAGRPLVATSGNVEGEPLACDSAEAQRDLAEVADLLLHHDRPIVRPIDDSVVRCIAGNTVTIRAARGIAPLPLKLDCDRSMLAVGGHQKVAIALCNGHQCVLGPHVGDLDSPATRERFAEQTQSLLDLYGAEPEVVVHDLHPDYFTSRWAAETGRQTLAVQHHHAHVVSGMIEQGWLDREVLGIAFDGTGYGPDGDIWGGEFLLATAESFTRIGSLRPFSLVGGDRAIREPWRVAISLVADACGTDTAARLFAERIDAGLSSAVIAMLQRGRAVRTSSLGRLFDGVAAIALGATDSSFEGQPAMMLEAACDQQTAGAYTVTVSDGSNGLQLDWRPLMVGLLRDREQGAQPGAMAMKFHRGVARAVAAVAERFQQHPIVLSGGCFQNRVLTELIQDALGGHPQPVGFPGTIPPNDGGLAAGQLAIAAAQLKHQSHLKRTD